MTQQLRARRHPLCHQPNQRQSKVKLHFRSRRNQSRMAQVQRSWIQLIPLVYTCGLTMTTDDTGTQMANGEMADAVIIGDRSMVVGTVARTTSPRDIRHRAGIMFGITGNEDVHLLRHFRLLLGPRPLLRQTTKKNTDCRCLDPLNHHLVHWRGAKDGNAEAGVGTEAGTEDVRRMTGFMRHATWTPIQIVTIVHLITGVESPANSCVGLTGIEGVEGTSATSALIMNVHEEGTNTAFHHHAPRPLVLVLRHHLMIVLCHPHRLSNHSA